MEEHSTPRSYFYIESRIPEHLNVFFCQFLIRAHARTSAVTEGPVFARRAAAFKFF